MEKKISKLFKEYLKLGFTPIEMQFWYKGTTVYVKKTSEKYYSTEYKAYVLDKDGEVLEEFGIELCSGL